MVRLRWAGVVATTPDRSLVACVRVEKRGGGWELPKGGVALGETALAAAARHCADEAGVAPDFADEAPRLLQGRGVFYAATTTTQSPRSTAPGHCGAWLEPRLALAALRADHREALLWALTLPSAERVRRS